MIRHIPGSALLLLSLAFPTQALATLSIFEHGNGIKAQGAGGASYVLGSEPTSIAGNPAHVLRLPDGYELGINIFNPHTNASIQGNAAGPDQNYKNHGSTYLQVPQAGWIKTLSPEWKVGMSAFFAGLGFDYDNSPYERFGGAHRSSLQFANGGLSLATAREVGDRHIFGASLNLGYQSLRVRGLGFASVLSESPDHVSDNGKDGSFGIGFTVGWLGQITDQLSAGMAYRSKSWAEKHDDYRGLLPDQGRLEAPQVFGGGFAYRPNPCWTFAVEIQRFLHSSQAAFGNRISRLEQGNLLGSDGGPGFGFGNLTAYKLGIEWLAMPKLRLRAGYITANQAGRPEETFFNTLAAISVTTHFTAGFTWQIDRWEVSAYGSHARNQTVEGRDSIAPAFGGGELHLSTEGVTFGMSLGKRF